MAVLKYNFIQKWQVHSLELGPPMYTFAFYWERHPFNLYLWYRADGSLDAAYFNVVDAVSLDQKQVKYRDLIVDVLLYPNGEYTVLDRHELTDDMPDEILTYIEAAQKELESRGKEIVAEARTFLALRGLDTEYRDGLTAQRLRLEPAHPELAKELRDYYRRNRDFLAPWEPLREERFFSTEGQREILEGQLHAADTLVFWIRLLSASAEAETGPLIGFVKFSNIIRGPLQSCFLSYALDAEHIKRGLMSEALERAIKYLFDFEQMHRIEANILPENEASLRTVSGLGFAHEGTARKYLKINGEWRDHMHMVLLNEEL